MALVTSVRAYKVRAHLCDVLGEGIDAGADLPRHRERVLGVGHVLLGEGGAVGAQF